MSDDVRRYRNVLENMMDGECWGDRPELCDCLEEAADEIERLRARIEELEKERDEAEMELWGFGCVPIPNERIDNLMKTRRHWKAWGPKARLYAADILLDILHISDDGKGGWRMNDE